MSNWGKIITLELAKIRERMKEPKAKFVLPQDVLRGGRISVLFHPDSRLLIGNNGKPVYVYIRDFIVGGRIRNIVGGRVWKLLSLNPRDLNKLHFTMCSTLVDMKKRNKFAKYQVTERSDDMYPIDLGNRRVETVRLNPCQNCLDELRYRGFSYIYTPKPERLGIVNSFSSKEAMNYIKDYFECFKEQTKELRPAYESADYPKNWKAISYGYRRSQNFICEKNAIREGVGCGVDLRHADYLTDAHHLNGVKIDTRPENLCCLCKLCHAKEDPHYRSVIKKEHADMIRQARKEQGIAA